MMLDMDTPSPIGPHRRERAVNRRVQGDIGELSAMEWLASKNATVWVPFTHSPHVDLMAEWNDRVLVGDGDAGSFRLSMSRRRAR